MKVAGALAGKVAVVLAGSESVSTIGYVTSARRMATTAISSVRRLRGGGCCPRRNRPAQGRARPGAYIIYFNNVRRFILSGGGSGRSGGRTRNPEEEVLLDSSWCHPFCSAMMLRSCRSCSRTAVVVPTFRAAFSAAPTSNPVMEALESSNLNADQVRATLPAPPPVP